MKNFSFRWLAAVASLAVVGCGGDDSATPAGSASSASSSAGSGGSGGGGGAGGSGGTGGGASDVTGTLADVHVTDSGDVLFTPPGQTIRALVPKDGGGYAPIAGTVAADGSFTIPSVPAGPYLIEVNGVLFVATSSHTLDLGGVFAGRPDTAYMTTSPTPLTVDVTGLDPWATGDALQLYVSNTSTYGDLSYDATFTPPPDGATSLVGWANDAAFFISPYEVDPAKGDDAFLNQLVVTTSNGFPYTHVAKSASTSQLTLKDGAPSNVSFALADVPQKTPVTVSWNRSAFAAYATDVNPLAQLGGHDLWIYGEPGGVRQTYQFPPTLADAFDASADTDVDLTLAWGNPFPATWSEVVSTSTYYTVDYAVPGGGTAQWFGGISILGTVATLGQAPLVPEVSPVREVTVGGFAVAQGATGVGLTPTVSWKAPALGTPKRYSMALYSLSQGDFFPHFVGQIQTTGTTVEVPAGLLQTGVGYIVVVTAWTFDADPDAPFKNANQGATADALSGLVMP